MEKTIIPSYFPALGIQLLRCVPGFYAVANVLKGWPVTMCSANMCPEFLISAEIHIVLSPKALAWWEHADFLGSAECRQLEVLPVSHIQASALPKCVLEGGCVYVCLLPLFLRDILFTVSKYNLRPQVNHIGILSYTWAEGFYHSRMEVGTFGVFQK